MVTLSGTWWSPIVTLKVPLIVTYGTHLDHGDPWYPHGETSQRTHGPTLSKLHPLDKGPLDKSLGQEQPLVTLGHPRSRALAHPWSRAPKLKVLEGAFARGLHHPLPSWPPTHHLALSTPFFKSAGPTLGGPLSSWLQCLAVAPPTDTSTVH